MGGGHFVDFESGLYGITILVNQEIYVEFDRTFGTDLGKVINHDLPFFAFSIGRLEDLTEDSWIWEPVIDISSNRIINWAMTQSWSHIRLLWIIIGLVKEDLNL